jgi:hypothetical protein
MNKKIGIIIGVVVAVVAIVLGVVFLAPDKDASVDNPTENITDVMNQDEVADVTEEITEAEEITEEATEESTEESTKAEESEYIPEGPGVVDIKKPEVMSDTLWLSANVAADHGAWISCEISLPYPTSLGTVYVVKETGRGEEDTFLFVVRQKDVLCANLGLVIPEYASLEDIYVKTVDLDGEAGEEIILNLFNGGQGGAGGFSSYIYKITKNKLVEMKQPDGVYEGTGFTATLRAPYEIVVTNKYNDEKCVISAKGNEEHEGFFDAKGNPENSGCSLGCDSFFTFEPVELEDGSYGVRRLQYSYIGSHANCSGYAETVIKYSANKKAFEVVSANFYEPNMLEETAGYSEYAYCDINEDGVDEFIIHTGTGEYDRIYNVYTYDDENRLVYVGAIEGWHATLYDGKKTITMAAQTSGEGFYYTYEMKNNRLKLVEKGDYTLDGNSSTLKNAGKAIEFKEY